MIEHFPFYLALVVAIVLIIMLSDKLKVAYPILLVIAGQLISFVPGVPVLRVDPELIFIIFLPPLLYEASWAISWKELWRWRRIITSFAFIVVFLTALSVALVTNAVIPGFSLALGFLLGGIVSPPDAVSAGAILKFVKVPKRMASILQGESLLNDASSLIIFRFSLIAVATGQFVWQSAALSLGWMLLGGIGVGLLIGWLFMVSHKYLPTDANMDIILTIITPYIMYLLTEEVHGSGVLSVVSGGLLLSYNRHRFLTSSSRLRGVNVWESLAFVLNGAVFLLIGLDLPEIIAGLRQDQISFISALGYGVLVTAVLVIVRMLSAYGAVVVTLIARNFIPVADTRSPGFKAPILLGWAGMRGVVSLAAALSIPAHLSNGDMFPHRNLILFITFVVIMLTLLGQGLTLPYLIRKIKLPDYDDYPNEQETENFISMGLAGRALQHLEQNYTGKYEDYVALQHMATKWKEKSTGEADAVMPEEARHIYLAILEQQRQWLLLQNQSDQNYDEEIIRKHLHRIDIEEEKMRFI